MMKWIGLLGCTLALFSIVAAKPAGDVKDPVPAAPAPQDPTHLPKKVQIYRLVVNSFWEVNCFILAGETNQAIVIDPGDELEWMKSDPVAPKNDKYRATEAHAKLIYDTLVQKKLKLQYIILTHGHVDHIGAIGYLKKRTGATIMMHADDAKTGYAKDAHMYEGGLPKVDRMLKDGELISLDGMVLQVIHTPGHSPGGICLRTRKGDTPYLFSGDTLLYHSVGRTNFKDGSGNEELLYKNIREKLFTLPENTVVLTGHYQFSTIGEEKKNNPFLNPQLLDQYIYPPAQQPDDKPKTPAAEPVAPVK